MTKKLSLISLLILAVAFTACGKEPQDNRPPQQEAAVTQPQEEEAKPQENPGEWKSDDQASLVVRDFILAQDDLPAPKDNSYIRELYITMLQINHYLDTYHNVYKKYPADLRDLKFPTMKYELSIELGEDKKSQESVKGYFNKVGFDPILIDYKKDSYGKTDNPMITVSYGYNFPKNRGYIQLRNQIIACVAVTGIAPANEACKTLAPLEIKPNPIRTYYNLVTELSPDQTQTIMEQIAILEDRARRGTF